MKMNSEELSLDKICQWHVGALKEFCQKRNLKTSGRKDELVAHVFAASEMKVPFCAMAVELVLQRTKKASCYKSQIFVYPIL